MSKEESFDVGQKTAFMWLWIVITFVHIFSSFITGFFQQNIISVVIAFLLIGCMVLLFIRRYRWLLALICMAIGVFFSISVFTVSGWSTEKYCELNPKTCYIPSISTQYRSSRERDQAIVDAINKERSSTTFVGLMVSGWYLITGLYFICAAGSKEYFSVPGSIPAPSFKKNGNIKQIKNKLDSEKDVDEKIVRVKSKKEKMKYVCDECEAEVKYGAKYCSECGNKLEWPE